MQSCTKLLTAGVMMLSVASFSTGAEAAQVCYRLTPFSDYLKLEVGALVNGHRNVYGNWVGSGSYTLPSSGALEFNLGTTTQRRLGIVGTNRTTNFGDNLICGLDGIPNGPWELDCAGGPGDDFRTTGSSLTVISCAGLPPSSAESADRLAGE